MDTETENHLLEPGIEPGPPATEPDPLAPRKRRALRFLALWSLFSGFAIFLAEEALLPDAWLTLLSFAYPLAATWWCWLDHAQRSDEPFPRWLTWLLILLPIAGFPVYAFRSRGRRGWRLILNAIALFGGYMLLMIASGAIAVIALVLIE